MHTEALFSLFYVVLLAPLQSINSSCIVTHCEWDLWLLWFSLKILLCHSCLIVSHCKKPTTALSEQHLWLLWESNREVATLSCLWPLKKQ